MKWLAERREGRRLRDEYVATDFGRRYGWWLCLDGARVAELNYRCYDIDSQFWHVYRLFPLTPRFDEVGFDPNRWCEPSVSLESRYAVGFRESDLLMAPRGPAGTQLVAIRSLLIPEPVFYGALRSAERGTAAG